MRISELEGKRIAIWGYGREGRAALAALRWRLPSQPVTVFCNETEAAMLATSEAPGLSIETEVTAAKLAAFEIIIKSPGISPYTSPAADAKLAGAQFVGGTELWFAEHPLERTICVTGTKGKSTVTALIAHLLRAAGRRTALAGNIGLPLLELLDVEPPPQYWVIELSSFQTGDAIAPEVAVVLNLLPEHLDWHGSEQRYIEDKLALLMRAHPRRAVLNATDTRLAALTLPADIMVTWFNHADGWHLRDNDIYRGEWRILDSRLLPLSGRHNLMNLCAALATVEALGQDAIALAPKAQDFKPLPHRLQSLGVRDGVEFVNDSISTTPHASIAALDTFKGRRVAILVGGFDRGLDWGIFVERMSINPPRAVVTMGMNGPRIFELLKPLLPKGQFTLAAATNMREAVRLGRELVDNDGVVLLSPGAPSFPRYTDYVQRGRHFAERAGFDPNLISAIPGLGVS